MKPVARFSSFPFIFIAALSCNVEQVSAPPPPPPDHSLALHRSGNAGNPDCRVSGRDRGNGRGPVDFLCAIEIPSPLTGSQKGWVEESNAKYFLSDASASGVQVIDIRTHTYVGLIGGMAGAATTGGGTATTNGPGPNSFVSVPRRGGRGHDDDDDGDRGRGGPARVLFVSDGNSTVHVVDMDRLRIIKSVSTAVHAGPGVPEASVCDDGTAHYCGRSNEIAYDPAHHVVIVQNPSPLRLTTGHPAGDGYATFISGSYPYNVLGHVFPGGGTIEGQVWVPELNRFLLPVQNPPATPGVQHIAVINTQTRQIEDRRLYTCAAIPGAGAAGNNNLQLAPGGNLWAQMCGRPIRMDVRTGAIKNVVTQVGTGDQDWYNPGDGNFYVTGAVPPADPNAIPPVVAGPAQLGVMNGRTGAFLQAVPNPGGASPSAYAKTNEIFTRVPFTAANDANSLCAVKGTGCVVVFAHVGTEREGGHD
jgi:hypothetical protein